MKTNTATGEAATKTPAQAVECEVIQTGHTETATKVSGADHSDFERLDEKVRKGAAAFMEIGMALTEIHDRRLWKAGGHPSWQAYCLDAIGMSKAHVHRLIDSSRVARELRDASPIGDPSKLTLPACESQLRPLTKVKDAATRNRLWGRAVEIQEGQPTASTVSKVVAEYMDSQKPSNPESTDEEGQADDNRPVEAPPAPATNEPPDAPVTDEETTVPSAQATVPNAWYGKKWLMTISEIRREALGKNRKDRILELTDTLRADIESAMPPPDRTFSNSRHKP